MDNYEYLLQGLVKLKGVGKWHEISVKYFNNKVHPIELELRTCLLLDLKDLKNY